LLKISKFPEIPIANTSLDRRLGVSDSWVPRKYPKEPTENPGI
jgi:hypothetical protein